MSGIDQVIARARQGEVAFSERKQFKLARRRAIEKLRRFALADPYFYILELIQAAIAGGADYVDIACDEGDVLVSWTGGRLREDELAQLFDFLFASKERLDLAHVRALALGVNALMLFEPEMVVIESGDGSEGGTARMVVKAGAEEVDVGRAEGKLRGTYVRAVSLNRDKVAAETGRRGDENGGLEYATVELRCLTAPVPLVFNSHSVFGWSSQRVPNLYGYKKAISFDEGDLYGTIGLDPIGSDPSFQLLTHGVWIQSYQHTLIPNKRIGGIVCFDRLHKTVDHSGFVRDDRFEEMWVRLRPHAEALLEGRAVDLPRITSAQGLAYSPTELRELLAEEPRVVVVSPAHKLGSRAAENARRIAHLLEAQLLRVPESQVRSVRVLGTRELHLWRPVVTDDEELAFYSEEPTGTPAEPWLLPPAKLEPPPLDALIDELIDLGSPFDADDDLGEAAPDSPEAQAQLRANQRYWAGQLDDLGAGGLLIDEANEDGELRERARVQLRAMIGETGTITATLYTPAQPGAAARGLLVRVATTGRQLGEVLFASAYPGRVLVVELPTAMPSAIRCGDTLRSISERFASRAGAVLREQDQRALTGLGVGKIEPDTVAAQLALEVLARVTVTRLRAARPGRLAPGLSFSLLRSSGTFDPFGLPLLRTLAGDPLSLRQLALMCDHTGGVVYGTIPEVPAALEGLDGRRILALSRETERALISLVGEAGYVRIDARDVLAEHEGVVVRDLALGLREYPDFPLLVEGAGENLGSRSADEREGLVAKLVEGLVGRATRSEHHDSHERALEIEEHRRQALRHLQWLACRELAGGREELLERLGLLDFPLFIDLDDAVWSLRQVVAALRSPEGLLVHYGHRFGASELGSISEAVQGGRTAPAEGRPASIAVSGFSHRLLAPLGRVRLSFDFDLDDLEAERNPMTSAGAFLVREQFESPLGSGVLGIPATKLGEHRIQLRRRDRGSVAALDEVAQIYGVVGSIELSDVEWTEETADQLIRAVDQLAAALLEGLIPRLPRLAEDPRRYEAALHVLLRHAGEQLQMLASPAGLWTMARAPLAGRILGLPLFDTGLATLVSANRMIELFRRHFEDSGGGAMEAFDWRSIIVPESVGAGECLAWLEATLHPAKVQLPASIPDARASEVQAHEPARASRRGRPDLIDWNLEYWLDRLRSDPRPEARDKPTKLWLVEHELSEGALVEGGDLRLTVSSTHPLMQRVCADPNPRNLAWVLLALYAHLNLSSGGVNQDHELAFQAAVIEALSSGSLQLLEPAPAEHG